MCFDAPREVVSIRGLLSAVRQVTVLGSGAALGHRITGGHGEVPGVLWIDAPSTVDPYATVLAVELDGELELYRGIGRN